ncbi:DNA topoisomerase 2-binding protein 1-like, partial [Saccoglossus kowalevskii]|uniref:DNA topoisomerase 2-binding protein 1-like n=1 Tax=Saccoglossus kowalevskii TaxID=10224 RepID=A0ABM0GZY9_SACKO
MANVIFVKAAVQTDELRKSYKAVDRAGLPCQMVSTEDIISKTEKDSFLYACDPFEGEAFEHLVKLGCRIVGPLCILHCMKRSEPIPKTDSPVYNITMKDCIVSCSSIAKARRTEIHKLVQWMGGVISKNFTDNVTHLVAAEVGSKKYH